MRALSYYSVGVLLLLLGACRIELNADAGGHIETASGSYLCSAGDSCIVDVEDGVDFDDTFVAVAAEGYVFERWVGYPCSEEPGNSCRIQVSAETSARFDWTWPFRAIFLPTHCADSARPFLDYLDLATVSCDEDYLYVSTATGLPELNPRDPLDRMMVGITAWINRVPLPFQFDWKIPLQPQLHEDWESASARGPIAFAVNGVPIFHAERRPDVDTDPRVYEYREENDTVLQGELDQCGGHAGQGEDYHYHYAPVCLLADHNLEQPIAYGLDGIPVYFGTGGTDYYGAGRFNSLNSLPSEPLDDCNALEVDAGEWAYYTTAEFPYVIGCHRAAVEAGASINVPPLADRDFGSTQPNGLLAGEPIATEITDFYADDDDWRYLAYGDGETLSYRAVDGEESCWDFRWSDAPDPLESYRYCR